MAVSATDFLPSLDLSVQRIAVDRESRRIAVRVASWGDQHSGVRGARMPRNVNVDAAHVGSALLADGSSLPVAQLPMGTLHADAGLSAAEARRVYEDTGRSVARVRYSLDDDGIRADGVLYEDVDDSTLDRLVASAPSGDWRTMSHVRSMDEFEHAPSDFVGAAIVNLPGFSNTFSDKPGTPMRLVASGESMILFEDGVVVGVETGNEAVDELTAAAASDGSGCVKPCEGCTCERKNAYAAMSASGDGSDPLRMVTISGDALKSLVAAAQQVAIQAVVDTGETRDASEAEIAAGVVAVVEAGLVETIAEAEAALVAAGYDSSSDAVAAHEHRMDVFEQRLADLEQLIADALLSM